MRENPVPDEVVRCFDFDVPDLPGTQGGDGDDGVPENGISGIIFTGAGDRTKKFQKRTK